MLSFFGPFGSKDGLFPQVQFLEFSVTKRFEVTCLLVLRYVDCMCQRCMDFCHASSLGRNDRIALHVVSNRALYVGPSIFDPRVLLLLPDCCLASLPTPKLFSFRTSSLSLVHCSSPSSSVAKHHFCRYMHFVCLHFCHPRPLLLLLSLPCVVLNQSYRVQVARELHV